MLYLCWRSLFLSVFLLITLQGKNSYSYTVSDSTIDPLGILRRYDYLSTLRNNCAALCKGCNGIAKLENDICRCHIVSDYPMGCLQNIRRNAEILGVKLSPKYPVNRHKRCTGEAGLPPPLSGLSLGRILSSGLSGVNLDGQMVSAPSEALNTLSGLIAAPLFEQIRAVFGGDSETADNTIPGQLVQNLPKALSSFTNLLDTFNVALPRENVVGSPKDSDSSEMTLGDSFINDLIGSLPVINQVRAIFVGHPSSGGAENTLPVQLVRAVPKALTSAMEIFEPFNSVGLPRKMPASPRVDKSWLKDFDDDDDDNDDKFDSGVQSQSQKVIVSPIKSRSGKPTVPESIPTSYNSNEISTNDEYAKEYSLGKTNTNNVFQNIGNMLSSGDPQILQPQEAIIILT